MSSGTEFRYHDSLTIAITAFEKSVPSAFALASTFLMQSWGKRIGLIVVRIDAAFRGLPFGRFFLDAFFIARFMLIYCITIFANRQRPKSTNEATATESRPPIASLIGFAFYPLPPVIGVFA